MHLGDAATISAGAGGGFSFDTDAETIFGDIRVRNLTVTGVQSVIESTNLVIKDNIIVVNSGEAGAGITLTSGGTGYRPGNSWRMPPFFLMITTDKIRI